MSRSTGHEVDTHSSRRGWLLNRDFARLWYAATTSVFGSMVTAIALPFVAILALDGEAMDLAWLGVASLLPGFLFGLVAGVWVDRLPRRPILVGADLARAALIASVPLAWLAGWLSFGYLYAVAFAAGLITAIFDVAHHSFVPALVAREELVAANGKLAAGASSAEAGAFAAAGWLVQLLGAPLALLVDALTFLASALFLGGIRTAELPPPAAARRPLGHEILAGLESILRSRVLRALGAGGALRSLSFGLIGPVYLLYATRELGFAPGVLGVLVAVGSLSSLLGSLVAEPLGKRIGAGPSLIGGLAVAALAIFLLPLAEGAGVAAALFLIGHQLSDGAATVHMINDLSLRQATAAPELLGRINGSLQVASQGATLAGTLGGGLLAEAIGFRATLVVSGTVALLAVAWLGLSSVRSVRTLAVTRP